MRQQRTHSFQVATTAAWRVVVIGIITVGVGSACSNFVEFKCGPSGPGLVYGYKDCREAYKIYATELSFKLSLSVEGLQKVAKANANTELGEKVVKLAQDLDQTNIASQNQYVATCQLFNTGPCDPVTRERYYDELRKIREENDNLREIYAKVERLVKEPAPPRTLAIDPRVRIADEIEEVIRRSR